ncbi:hypothetical protein GQR58_014596 [Nymphon striatum]|nr:hypothetical protein GQR58_014596 [Nymphon striatum]
MGLQETFLLQSILKRKASFFGLIARGSAGEELKMIVAEGWRKVGRGRRRRRWIDDEELVTRTKDVRKNIEMAEDKERRREKSGRHIHHHQRFKEQYTLDTLSIGTHFTKREIQSIYRGFKQIRSYELPKITQYYVGQQDSCYVGIDHQPDTTCSQQLQLISFEFNVQNGWTKSPVSALNGSEALTCIENWTDEWASLSEWSLGIRHIERDLLPTVSSRK